MSKNLLIEERSKKFDESLSNMGFIQESNRENVISYKYNGVTFAERFVHKKYIEVYPFVYKNDNKYHSSSFSSNFDLYDIDYFTKFSFIDTIKSVEGEIKQIYAANPINFIDRHFEDSLEVIKTSISIYNKIIADDRNTKMREKVYGRTK